MAIAPSKVRRDGSIVSEAVYEMAEKLRGSRSAGSAAASMSSGAVGGEAGCAGGPVEWHAATISSSARDFARFVP